ncbi:hypothetical protein B0H19DRAFT_1267942 [Mycena capillaripes]|nr:hypothetical protein B0H19DRAFT_1267942 [Mycena capillaripes]
MSGPPAKPLLLPGLCPHLYNTPNRNKRPLKTHPKPKSPLSMLNPQHSKTTVVPIIQTANEKLQAEVHTLQLRIIGLEADVRAAEMCRRAQNAQIERLVVSIGFAQDTCRRTWSENDELKTELAQAEKEIERLRATRVFGGGAYDVEVNHVQVRKRRLSLG